jgi:hypothetical protein
LAIELLLAWAAEHSNEQPEAHAEQEVLAHVDLDTLPASYLRTLAASGRLCADDERALVRAARRAATSRHRKVRDCVGAWVGRFGTLAGSVALAGDDEGPPLRLVVTPLSDYPIDLDGSGVQHTSMCLDVDDQVLTFKALAPEHTVPHVYAGVHAPTGFTLRDGQWRAFGVVPRFMHHGTFAAAAHGTCVYFVAMTTHHCARLDVATGVWTVLPPLRTPREWPCVAVLDEHLYVLGGARPGLGGIGGLTGIEGALAPLAPLDGADPFAPLPTERMALTAEGGEPWTCSQSFARVATYRCAAVAVAGGIYVLGGCFREPTRPSLAIATGAVARFDPESDRLAECPPMLAHRHGHGAFATGSGHVVALGGRHCHARPRLPLAECFDPSARAWRALEIVLASGSH